MYVPGKSICQTKHMTQSSYIEREWSKVVLKLAIHTIVISCVPITEESWHYILPKYDRNDTTFLTVISQNLTMLIVLTIAPYKSNRKALERHVTMVTCRRNYAQSIHVHIHTYHNDACQNSFVLPIFWLSTPALTMLIVINTCTQHLFVHQQLNLITISLDINSCTT